MRIRPPSFLPKPVVLALIAVVVGGTAAILLFALPPPDTEPPSQVVGVLIEDRLDGRLALSWRPATDDRGVAGYRVYRDGRVIAQVGSSQAAYEDSGLPVDVTFVYRVAAVDGVGREGLPSETVAAESAPSPPSVFLGGWTEEAPSTWHLAVLNVSRSLNVSRFEVALVINGSVIAISVTPLAELPEIGYGVTLAFVDAAVDGRLSSGDFFMLQAVAPGVTYTVDLIYEPTADLLSTASLAA